MAESVKKAKTKYGEKIAKCSCTGTLATDYQDSLYGKGMRVYSYAKLGKELRCTCCGRMTSLNGEQTAKAIPFQQQMIKQYCKVRDI